jgi:hypothetical protein
MLCGGQRLPFLFQRQGQSLRGWWAEISTENTCTTLVLYVVVEKLPVSSPKKKVAGLVIPSASLFLLALCRTYMCNVLASIKLSQLALPDSFLHDRDGDRSSTARLS